MKGKKAGSSGRNADLTMAERNEIEQIVERVVSQVLDSHVPQLREELVRRVMEELPEAAAASGASGENGSANLLKAISPSMPAPRKARFCGPCWTIRSAIAAGRRYLWSRPEPPPAGKAAALPRTAKIPSRILLST